MDFEWSKQQNELISLVRQFAERELHQPPFDRYRNGEFGRREWELCGSQGLLGLPIPRKYGGLEQGALMTAKIMETLGEVVQDRGLLFAAAAHTFACVVPIWKHGTDQQKEEFLPRLCSGEWIGANAATEREAGSDIFAMRTTAIRDRQEYELSGHKSFVSNGPIADVFLVYATVDRTLGALGITSFIVPKQTKGLCIGSPFSTIGLRTAQMGMITLNECRVPANQQLGREGSGRSIFEVSMTWERLCLFGIWVGFMEAQLKRSLDFAKRRQQFGKPIGKNQAVSHRIVDMKLRLESARWMLYRACWLFDRGCPVGLESSLSKLAISEGAIRSSLDVIQIHGAVGVTEESGLDVELRDAIPGTIYSGTSEMHREMVARALGL